MVLDDPADGYTMADAATLMGISRRQLERYIHSARVTIIKVPGRFGPENRVVSIPLELLLNPGTAPQPTGNPLTSSVVPSVDTPIDTFGQQVIADLTEQVIRLSAQLGMAHEKNRVLEDRVLLLTTPRPWWRRVFLPWSRLTLLTLTTASITFAIVALVEALETRNTLNWFMGS